MSLCSSYLFFFFNDTATPESYTLSLHDALPISFTQLDTHRLWLDVYPDNLRGIRLYESLGMHQDGVLRQNYLSDRGYLDQIIYSLLRSEYTAMESRFQEG